MQEPLLKKRINHIVLHFLKYCLFSVCMELWCRFFPGAGDIWDEVKNGIPPYVECISCY